MRSKNLRDVIKAMEERRKLLVEVRDRYDKFSEIVFTPEPHTELAKGCRCGSCIVITGYVIDAGMLCCDAPEDPINGSTKGCVESVLTYEQAEYLVQAIKDVGILLDMMREKP